MNLTTENNTSQATLNGTRESSRTITSMSWNTSKVTLGINTLEIDLS